MFDRECVRTGLYRECVWTGCFQECVRTGRYRECVRTGRFQECVRTGRDLSLRGSYNDAKNYGYASGSHIKPLKALRLS